MASYIWKNVFQIIYNEYHKNKSSPSRDYKVVRNLIESRRKYDVDHSIIKEDELIEYLNKKAKHLIPLFKTQNTSEDNEIIQLINNQIDYLRNHIQYLTGVMTECQEILNKYKH